jgi:tetratricopeptide (TPR) repeat protein
VNPVVSSLLFAAVLAAAAPRSSADDPLPAEAQARAQEALAQARSVRGAAALVRLRGLRDDLADPRPVDGTFERIASDPRSDPFTRTLARQVLADLDVVQGRVESAQRRIRSLGYVQEVYVLGGFDNEGKTGCDTDAGPEKSLALDASLQAKGHEARWRRTTARSLDGGIDLGAMLRPSRGVVAYVLALLDERAARRTVLALGTSGGFRLWVNGEKVASGDAYHPARPDQERVSVQLRAGVNRVLLKVCHEDSGVLGAYLRDESARARPVTPGRLPSLRTGPAPAARRLPTLSSTLQADVARRPDDPRLRADLAQVLEATQAFDSREHSDAVNADRAAADASRTGRPDARLELLAARLQQDENVRRRHLEAALAAAPDLLEARVLLARAELSQGHPERVLPLLQPLVKRWKAFVPAQVLLARAEDELGDPVSATRRIEELPPASWRIPEAARERVRAARRLDRTDEALERLGGVLQGRPGDGSSLSILAEMLADGGDATAAADALRSALRLSPTSNDVRLRLAELLASNGRLEEGLTLFSEAEALCPDDPEIFERKGRTLLYAGRKEPALAALDRSLVLRPQNPALRDAVRALRGTDTSAATVEGIDIRPLVAEADSYAEDAVTLADITRVRVQQSGLSGRFHQLAVKVYTRRGVDAFRSFPITYSPSREEVRILRARITKPDGSLVESFGDTSRSLNEPWAGMYYDAQAKVLSFPGLAPGDVLELQYRVEDTASDNLLSDYWGDLSYVQGVTPKLRWEYVVDMPAGRTLYWNEKTLGAGVSARREPTSAGRVLYRFGARHVSRITPEPGMPGWSEVAATLHVSTYRTWEDVGRYYWSLIRDQLVPDDSIRRAAEGALVGVDRKDTRAVVRALYEYVVKNTRYVALEFGIHGYKPYRVDRVLARRFGDCKDKASLLHALLQVAGVESRIVLLRMRQLGAVPAEPASLAVFNHAIIWVPGLDWYLDGTAEFHGATELPVPDRRASILIVEPDGKSRFTVTPEARPEDNITDVQLDLALGPGGAAEVKGESRVSGSAAPEYRRSYQSAATRRTTFEQGWAQTFPGLSVDKVSISDPTRLDQDVALDYQLSIPRYAEVGGDTLRFLPFGSRRGYVETYAGLAERRGDLVLDGPSVSRFTFRYRLPQGWSVDALPPDVTTESGFGKLHLTYAVEQGMLVCRGELVFTRDRISANEYPAFRAFVAGVDQAFSRKVMVRAPRATSAPQRADRPSAPAVAPVALATDAETTWVDRMIATQSRARPRSDDGAWPLSRDGGATAGSDARASEGRIDPGGFGVRP